MNIIIAGGGKVGSILLRLLSSEGHDLTLIDARSNVVDAAVEKYDVIGIKGNCASMPVLVQSGIKEADLLIASAHADEINLLTCMTAKVINPDIHTIARIRNPEYTSQIYEMPDTFGISMAFNPERQAALEIERLLKYPGFLRRDTFVKGRAEIVELRISADSKLCNITLSELPKLVGCHVLVCAVLRHGNAIAPNGDFMLRQDDKIFVTAPSKELIQLLKSLGILSRRVRSVFICGGGKVGYYLAKMLSHSGIATKVVEHNYERCQFLSTHLPEVDVICGDISNHDLLKSEELFDHDALVTLTGLDEINMINSLYGSSHGIPHIVTKLSHLENNPMLDTFPLGSIICPSELCSSAIVRYVRAMQNQTGAALSMHLIADGQVEAIEFLVEDSTPHCGTPLKEIKLRPGVLLGSITHGSTAIVPSGDSCFYPGDILVVVTSCRGTLQQLTDIFR